MREYPKVEGIVYHRPVCFQFGKYSHRDLKGTMWKKIKGNALGFRAFHFLWAHMSCPCLPSSPASLSSCCFNESGEGDSHTRSRDLSTHLCIWKADLSRHNLLRLPERKVALFTQLYLEFSKPSVYSKVSVLTEQTAREACWWSI